MDKYLEAEKRLAELLGYVPRYAHRPTTGEWVHAASNTLIGYQAWCRKWEACGPLMAEYSVMVDPLSFRNSVEAMAYAVGHTESYANHPDKDTAVRYSIVMAVIAKLEGD